MKFGRLLKTTSVDVPEMEALFSAYKTLKKHVKRLPYKEQIGQQGTLEMLSEEENNFVTALSQTLHQLNEMFLEKEENSVIRVERLEHALAVTTSPEQLNELHKQFVDFHGEVLLLVHWSILAYTATVKILKKHHKRTGLLVKAPQLGNLLSQPFCSTELMTSIAHRVEQDIQRLAERMGVSGQRNSERTEQQQQQQGQQQDGVEPPAVEHAAAVVAAVAAAASAVEVPQLANGGLDFRLLQQLADSGSITTPSDTEYSNEDDTAHHAGKRLLEQQQLLQERSQQAHLQDKGTVSEVQHEPKRRRLSAAEAAAEAAVDSPDAASNQQQQESAAAATAAAPAAPSQQEPQQLQQQEPGVAQVAAAAAAVEPDSPPHKEQHLSDFLQPLPPIAPLLPQRCSTTGCAAADAIIEQQLHQHAHASGLQSGAGSAAPEPCSLCARHGSIMRQTQVALTTWQHLQSTASTPSTVVPGTHLLHATATVLTESSAV